MMPRIPFYEVARETYLFPEKVKESEKRRNLEEPVRQWCAFELIRAYGIPVTDLIFEHPVHVGSKSYSIDILILCDGRLWAVVECKKPNARKLERGMGQAVSYAKNLESTPEFAVFTDGEAWNVQRCVDGNWVPVPDLPIQRNVEPKDTLRELLWTLENVGPLLFKLDEALDGVDARNFLKGMQRFFHGQHLLAYEIDPDLRAGADNLVRAVIKRADDDGYWRGKLSDAQGAFEDYRQKRELGLRVGDAGSDDLSIEARYMGASIQEWLRHSKDLRHPDVLTLRVILTVLNYAQLKPSTNRQFPPIEQEIHHELRKLLDYTLTVSMGVSLPDKLDSVFVGDVKNYFRSAWQSVESENRLTCSDLIGSALEMLKLRR